MFFSTLSKVNCVNPQGKRSCDGLLVLDFGDVIPQIIQDDEIVEGILKCKKCGSWYPILGGVGILHPRPQTYLRRSFSQVFAFLERNDCPISKSMVKYICSHNLDVPPLYMPAPGYDDLRLLSRYILGQYGNYNSLPVLSSLFGSFLSTCKDSDLYSVLLEMVTPFLNEKSRVLDLGCNVGHVTAEIAPLVDEVYGIDLSFYAIFVARAIVIGKPKKKLNHALLNSDLTSTDIEIEMDSKTNVEFLVGDGLLPPVQLRDFNTLCAINVIDSVDDPLQFVKQTLETMAPGTFWLHSSCYHWDVEGTSPLESWLDGRHGSTSAEVLKLILSKQGTILEERDGIPWIFRDHARAWSVFLNHCLLFQKKTSD